MYVLEWRTPGGTGRGRALVSHLRLFRSAVALQALVRSRRFAARRAAEFRVSRRPDGQSVVTNLTAILAWDCGEMLLPAPLCESRWAAELGSLGAADRVHAAVADELVRARAAGLLSRPEVDQVLALLARLLFAAGRA